MPVIVDLADRQKAEYSPGLIHCEEMISRANANTHTCTSFPIRNVWYIFRLLALGSTDSLVLPRDHLSVPYKNTSPIGTIYAHFPLQGFGINMISAIS